MPARKTASRGRGKVGKVMREYKHGTLKSGGKNKVRNRKQAVAAPLMRLEDRPLESRGTKRADRRRPGLIGES